MQFSLIDLQKIKNDLQYEKIFAHGQARKDIIKKISAINFQINNFKG